MGSLADALAPRELHEQRGPFHLHGANFLIAVAEAERLEMAIAQCALTQALGAYAQNQRSFSEAAECFQRFAELNRARGEKKNEAAAYHQLGRIAQEQRDFASARDWYQKALHIDEKLGNEHGAAITYGQLGIVADLQDQYEEASSWLIRSIRGFLRTNDRHLAVRNTRNLRIVYNRTPEAGKEKLRAKWEEAGLGSWPLDDAAEETESGE